MKKDSEFDRLLASCQELAEFFPDGVVFIGGIAVYLHVINQESTADVAEATHDADLYISLADMADLRDAEEVTPNRRLNRHQMVKGGFEFDIYTERQSDLIVPYDAIAAYAQAYDGIRVAAPEHLMALKLEAYADRKGSAKGEKDARDVIRICLISQASSTGFRPELALPYLRDEHFDLLRAVIKSPQIAALAHGNAQAAKSMRQKAQHVFDRLIESPTEPVNPAPPKARG